MKAHGNGDSDTCALNLLRIKRGEIAYSRTKGLRTDIIHRPISLVSDEIIPDVRQQINIFEPRVNASEFDVLGAVEEIEGENNEQQY